MPIFLLIFTFLPICQIFSWTILDLISEKGKEGDTVIVEYASTIYAIRLHTKPISLTIAKAPEQLKERAGFSSWIDWMNHDSEGALEIVSCPIKDLKEQSSELFTFLSLSWKEQEKERRKKQGPTPLADEFDFRPIWNPKIIREGSSIKGMESGAFEAIWPNDGSDVSNRIIVAYFPYGNKAVTWFPYWIEFFGGKRAIFVLDSQIGCSNE
jgi:hypothetical protein